MLSKLAYIGCVAAGAVIALSARKSFAESPIDSFFAGQPDRPQILENTNTSHPLLSLVEQDRLSSSKFSSSWSFGALNFGVSSDFRESTKIDGTPFLGFVVGNDSKRQENQVAYTNVNMDLGETVRVKTRLGSSTYEAPQQFFNTLSKAPEDQRELRFANVGIASGSASLTRVEEDLLRFGDAKVMFFQELARVNRFFEDLKFADKAQRQQTKDDVFSKPDRETSKYGVSFLRESSGIMFSQSSISNIIDDPASFYREQRFDSKAWLGIRDLFKGFGNAQDSVLGNFLPSNVWVSYGESNVRRTAVPTAGITEMSAGAGWSWGSLYTNFGVWRYVESDPQLAGNLSARTFSEGADLSIGINRNKWNVSGWVSVSRSNYDQAPYTLSNSSNYYASGGASLTFKMERWPNLTLAFDVNKYGDAYLASGADTGRISTAGIALDFSKYLVERGGQKLQLFYYARDQGYDGTWGGVQSHSLTLAHVFGGVVRSRW